MIFVTVGSQKFQFNRLLREIDRLIEEKIIIEKVFAQIGHSDYKPKNYDFKEFLDRDEFTELMNKCDKVITHGGTGAIIGAIKQRKKVIAIPRLKEFQEHIDNHQKEIAKIFKENNYIEVVLEIEKLQIAISSIKNKKFEKFASNTKSFIDEIEKCLIL